MSEPLVSIVMPVRNEAGYIERALAAVLAQDWPPASLEVIVVDGYSDDDTARLAEAVLTGGRLRRWAIVDNPRSITPVSLNLGVRHSSGEFVVRVDGHCEIAPDYVRRCIEVLRATQAECVGGVCETVAETEPARAIAAAQSSRFGVGNVAFRVGHTRAARADTVPFGAYPRAVIDRLGGWDEELVRNQDDEFNFRLVQSGGTVWYDPTIRCRYYSRSEIPRLWRQYFQYGLYKVRVMQKRRAVASARQLVPGALVASLVAGTALTAFSRKARWALLPTVPYVAVNVAVSVALGRRHRVPWTRVMAAFSTLHLGYGSGFLVGIWRWRNGFLRRPPHDGAQRRREDAEVAPH